MTVCGLPESVNVGVEQTGPPCWYFTLNLWSEHADVVKVQHCEPCGMRHEPTNCPHVSSYSLTLVSGGSSPGQATGKQAITVTSVPAQLQSLSCALAVELPLMAIVKRESITNENTAIIVRFIKYSFSLK